MFWMLAHFDCVIILHRPAFFCCFMQQVLAIMKSESLI